MYMLDKLHSYRRSKRNTISNNIITQSTNQSENGIKKVLIQNITPAHLEIIETIIVRFKEIFDISGECQIYLNAVYSRHYNNSSFREYITSKYPDIIIDTCRDFDYFINCTVYDRLYDRLVIKPNYFYISHDVTERMEQLKNVYFLTPLAKRFFYADLLPYQDTHIDTDYPIYAIQGNITPERRNYNLLIKLLEYDFSHKFKIKLIGRGELDSSLKPYANRLIIKNNLEFVDYHKEFCDCYGIIPLITKMSHPRYYTSSLTSSINYAKAYKLQCIIDKDLQEIYNLPNSIVFTNEDDIINAFQESLDRFYK